VASAAWGLSTDLLTPVRPRRTLPPLRRQPCSAWYTFRHSSGFVLSTCTLPVDGRPHLSTGLRSECIKLHI